MLLFQYHILRLASVECDIAEKVTGRGGQPTYVLTVADPKSLEALFRHLPPSSRKDPSVLAADWLKKECCRRAFLRGAFLSCGAVCDPSKGYHLELVTQSEGLCLSLGEMMGELSILSRMVERKGSYVRYLKESGSIEDFLNFIGASSSALKIMELKVLKDMRNNVNRIVNCETANITKTVDASRNQLDAIGLIAAKRGLESLDPALKSAAQLRLENPDMSLSQLGGLVSPPITRSGMNHRLKKIMEIAARIREADGEVPEA